jgi:uncharacterized protein (TIGR02246 family)
MKRTDTMAGSGRDESRGRAKAVGAEVVLDASEWREIVELYSRFSASFDEGNGEAVADLFAPDGVFVRGDGTRIIGAVNISQYVIDATSTGSTTRHMPGLPVIRAVGDGASGSCYVMTFVVDAGSGARLIVGEYGDEFVRSPAGWKLAARQFTVWLATDLATA